jgi:HlyD family secretion protein
LLAADGRSARKIDIVLGRQNPQMVEVLEGLKSGDWIVTSNYEGFNNVDQLTFNKPVARR